MLNAVRSGPGHVQRDPVCPALNLDRHSSLSRQRHAHALPTLGGRRVNAGKEPDSDDGSSKGDDGELAVHEQNLSSPNDRHGGCREPSNLKNGTYPSRVPWAKNGTYPSVLLPRRQPAESAQIRPTSPASTRLLEDILRVGHLGEVSPVVRVVFAGVTARPLTNVLHTNGFTCWLHLLVYRQLSAVMQFPSLRVDRVT